MAIWQQLKTELIKLSETYPTRWWWPVVRIYGGPIGNLGPCYMTRIKLCPAFKGGRQLYLHVFHREDMDRDPHDHPFAYWTFPLNTGYIEEVFDSARHCFRYETVPLWKISRRPATHRHRIIGTRRGQWPLVTLVWRGPTIRQWGFWCYVARNARTWVFWKNYVDVAGTAEPGVANRDGDTDHPCPGQPKRPVCQNWAGECQVPCEWCK